MDEEVEEVYVQQERRNARRGRGQLRWRGAYGEDGYIILQFYLLVFCWLVRTGFKPFAPGAQGKIVEYRSVGPEDPVPIQLFGWCVERCSVRCCVESPMAGIFFWGAKALQHPNRAAPVADDVLGAGLVPLSGAPRIVRVRPGSIKIFGTERTLAIRAPADLQHTPSKKPRMRRCVLIPTARAGDHNLWTCYKQHARDSIFSFIAPEHALSGRSIIVTPAPYPESAPKSSNRISAHLSHLGVRPWSAGRRVLLLANRITTLGYCCSVAYVVSLSSCSRLNLIAANYVLLAVRLRGVPSMRLTEGPLPKISLLGPT